MTRGAAILLILADLAFGQTKKPSKKSKSPDAVVLKPAVHLGDGMVTLDGLCVTQVLKAVVPHIDFLGPNRQLLTTCSGPIESELLDLAQEAEFHLQVKAPLRAISVRFKAMDADGHDLRLENDGPHVID